MPMPYQEPMAPSPGPGPTCAHCTPLSAAQLHRSQVRWQKPPCHCAARAEVMKGKKHLSNLSWSSHV